MICVFPKKFYADTCRYIMVCHLWKFPAFPVQLWFFISLTIHTVWSCIAHLNKSMQLSIVYFDLQRSKFQGMVAASIASEFKPEKSTRLSRDFQEGSCLLLQIMCNPISSHAIFTFRLLIALSYVLFISLLEIYEHNIYATTLVITLTDSQFMSLELWQKKYKIKTMILE